MDRQLTFETALNSERKVELHIPTNPSVKAKDKKRLSRQSKQIYEMLKAGPVKTSVLVSMACQYSARLSEIRHTIVKDGLMIDVVEGEGGENTFQIVSLERSTFWQRVREQQQEWKWR